MFPCILKSYLGINPGYWPAICFMSGIVPVVPIGVVKVGRHGSCYFFTTNRVAIGAMKGEITAFLVLTKIIPNFSNLGPKLGQCEAPKLI